MRTTSLLSCLAAASVCVACASSNDGAPVAVAVADAGSKVPDLASAGDIEVWQRIADASRPTINDAIGSATQPQNGSAVPATGLKPGGPQHIAAFRQRIQAGQVPQPDEIPLIAWLNEHHTPLPAPDPKKAVDLVALAGVVLPKSGPADALVQLGLQTPPGAAQPQAPIALTLVLDRSGTMVGEKLAGMVAGVKAMAATLPAGSRLALVTFASDVRTDRAPAAWHPEQQAALAQLLAAIEPGGGTNLHGALELGLNHCQSAPVTFTFRHVMLLTDGYPTDGNTSGQALVKLAKDGFAKGCTVSAIGVGGEYNPKLLNNVAIQGGGVSYFSLGGAGLVQVFTSNLKRMLVAIAKDVHIRLKTAAGWTVTDVPGFSWHAEAGWIKLGTPLPAQESNATTRSRGDATSAPPPDFDDKTVPALHPSDKNGLVVVRLQPPPPPLDVANLELVQVEYSYTVVGAAKAEEWAVKAQVPGLVQIADGGTGYFTDPVVERTYALVVAGVALQQACVLFQAGKAKDAAATLDLATQRVTAHQQAILKDNPGKPELDPAPGLADALSLIAELRVLVAK